MERMGGGVTRVAQHDVIAEFLRVYNDAAGAKYEITEHPDERNRVSRDIDAFAECEGRAPLAIEHTLVQTMPSQKLDDARFTQVFLPISRELEHEMPMDMDVILEHGALQTGTDWTAIGESLKAWLREHVESLPVGFSEHGVPGVPFEVAILRPRDGAGVPFAITRMAEPEELPSQTVECMRAALLSKDEQLRKYSEAGAESVLLLESQDWALTNPLEMRAAYLKAREGVAAPHIQQVWFARFSESGATYGVLCFDGPQQVMDSVNPRNLCWTSGQHTSPPSN